MSNERCLELIHAEIDRALSSQERAELNQYLLADPESRLQRDQLIKACALLDAVEPVAVPEGFTRSLMQRLEQAAVLPSATRLIPAWQRFMQPSLMRYAAAFGGGLVVAALAFGTGTVHDTGQDMASLAGTMASPTAPAPIPSEELRVDMALLTGTARLRHSESGELTLIELQLRSEEPVEVVADFNGQSVRLQRSGGQDGHFGLVLNEPANEVTVRFMIAGELVHQGVLRSANEG